MTRINSSISVKNLTDEHLLAEHREIKRLPNTKIVNKNDIPREFCLGKGHVKFFTNKFKYTLDRYKQLHEECLNRGFNVIDYSNNWNNVTDKSLWNDYSPTNKDRELLIDRITERINGGKKDYYHYNHSVITKLQAIEFLNK